MAIRSSAVSSCIQVRNHRNNTRGHNLASFPGLPRLQFLIACGMQKMEGEGLVNLTTWSAAQVSHVVMLICIVMLGRRPILRSVLATKMRQALMENKIKCTKHIRARRKSSEGLPNDSVKYLQWENFAYVAKKQPLLDLQCLQRNHPSAVLLQTWVWSTGRTCLSAGTCLVSLASL